MKDKIIFNSIMDTLMDNATNTNKNNNINDLTNYNERYTNSTLEIYELYNTLLTNFINHFSYSVVMHDRHYYSFILKNGIDMMFNVFSLIYYYSKNARITKYYSERALFIYCEFVGKLAQNNSDHSFLKLNVKDALLFVYKKTIFDINNTHMRNFTLESSEKKYIEHMNICISLLTDFYKTFSDISIYLYNYDTHASKQHKDDDVVTSDDCIIPMKVTDKINSLMKTIINEHSYESLESIVNIINKSIFDFTESFFSKSMKNKNSFTTTFKNACNMQLSASNSDSDNDDVFALMIDFISRHINIH